MKFLFKKLNFIDSLTTEVEIDKKNFVKAFDQKVSYEDSSWFDKPMATESKESKKYKGSVHDYGFEIIKNLKKDTNVFRLVAQGKLIQNGKKLLIQADIKGYTRFSIFFMIMCLLIELFMCAGIIFTDKMNGINPLLALLLVIVHGFMMIGIPILMIGKNVKRFKEELEMEIFKIGVDNS